MVYYSVMVYYNVTPRRERPTVGQVYVEATSADRAPVLASELEADLGDAAGVDYDTEIFKNGPPVEAPVAIKTIGPELPTLRTPTLRTLAADVVTTTLLEVMVVELMLLVDGPLDRGGRHTGSVEVNFHALRRGDAANILSP